MGGLLRSDDDAPTLCVSARETNRAAARVFGLHISDHSLRRLGVSGVSVGLSSLCSCMCGCCTISGERAEGLGLSVQRYARVCQCASV